MDDQERTIFAAIHVDVGELLARGGVMGAVTIDFTELAQDCTDVADFQARVLESLQHAVGFDAAFFLAKGGPPSLTTVGLGQDVAARLTDRSEKYASELAPVRRAALAGRGVAIDTAVSGLQHVKKTSYFREIAATVGGQHALVAFVPWRGRTAATVMLGRCGRTFSRENVALVESLLPRLGVARAALGLPAWSPPPLPRPSAVNLMERLRRLNRGHVLASVSTDRGTIQVRDRNGFREMVATDGTAELIWTRASLSDASRSGWPYSELLHLAPALATRRSRALFIGSGGGVSLHQFARSYPGIQLDLVEHEPAVLGLAQDWFCLDAVPNLTVHVADGAAFIEGSPPASWDLIILDAFDTKTNTSGHLQRASQRAATRALRRALRTGGAVAWNVIGSLARSGPVSELVSSARTVFQTVRIVPVVDVHEQYAPDTVRNIVVIAA